MGDPGTALLINSAAFGAYLAGVVAVALALGLIAASRRPLVRWAIVFLCIPAACIAFIGVAEAGANSWHVCAH
jgi:hypothetical protein